MLSTLETLRKELHQNPEISGKEYKTAERLQKFISEHYPGTIVTNIGGPSFAVIYDFGFGGSTVAIRCELDALPILEENDFEHISKVEGVSHKCGHDGHMTMVTGLIFWLQQQEKTFTKGKVILLFQTAEETGKGAYEMLEDTKFKPLEIDYIFALHNIPGEELHTVITMQEGFSAEVESFVLKLKGLGSHAAEPQNGINPAVGIADLVSGFDKLNNYDPNKKDFKVLTPVHIRMGEANYGISPGSAELHYTIRSWTLESMNVLKSEILKTIEILSKKHKLEYELEWLEHFPASENDPTCNKIINKVAHELNFNVVERAYPFKFGEDFGWFSRHYKTGMFGLGSGINTPPLHNPSYDFPNEIIPTGIQMFSEIIATILLEK